MSLTEQLPFRVKEAARETLLSFSGFRRLWERIGEWRLLSGYRQRRDHYHRLAQERGLAYREPEAIQAVRDHIREKGLRLSPKKPGEVHTFAFFPNLGWHRHLLPDLRELGPVTWFDYEGLDYHLTDFLRADTSGIQHRRDMNDRVIPALREAHAANPVDWVFVYANGCEIRRDTICRITDELGIPVVNMCLDEKHSWQHLWMGDHRGGQIDIASACTLSWTSILFCTEWYLAEGARPFYLPEGFDQHEYRPEALVRDIPVSFIGAAYGFRRSVIAGLEAANVPITTYGKGWRKDSYARSQTEIFNRSRINLGMGGIGYSEFLTHLKGRDFEIPATGGGVYLTSFSPELARHFDIGREILCYRGFDDMIDLIRYYLNHEGEAQEIARRGLERCRRDHRWLHRFQRVLAVLGILPPA